MKKYYDTKLQSKDIESFPPHPPQRYACVDLSHKGRGKVHACIHTSPLVGEVASEQSEGAGEGVNL